MATANDSTTDTPNPPAASEAAKQGIVDKAKAAFVTARAHRPWLDHAIATQERYTDRRGNLHAANITFTAILSLVPIIMVAFAIGGFVLASRPELLAEIQERIVEALPGELGTQLGDVIDSAIESRATVGVIGLLGAAFTGIGWIGGVRNGMTEMFGGRVQRNFVLSKVFDLLTFVGLGVAFIVTMALTALGNSSLAYRVLGWVALDDMSWAPTMVRIVSILVSILASWLLFSFVLARLPLVPLLLRNTLKVGLATAIVFEILKSFGGLYLKSVLSGPAGVAFGPILGVLVFGYLASRIILYATAWCATDPVNAESQVVEGEDELDELKPVVIAPRYEVHPAPQPAALATAAGVGAVLSLLLAKLLRR